MPITLIEQQRRLREIGRIRMGDTEQVTRERNGKTEKVTRPRKLATFRLTSRDERVVRAAAEQYGGDVRDWAAPDGKQWELYTATAELDVIVPPTEMAFSQWFESWTAGGCDRRCDGDQELISGKACLCDPDARTCKMTTRLSLILPSLPGLGVWRLETHGYYGATELAGAVELCHQAFSNRGQLLPARLRIEQRQVKRKLNGKVTTLKFPVPTLDLDVSFAALQAGLGRAADLQTGEVLALDSVTDTPGNRVGFTPVPELPPGPAGPSVAEQVAQVGQPKPRNQRSNAAEPIRATGLRPRPAGEVSGTTDTGVPEDGDGPGVLSGVAAPGPSPEGSGAGGAGEASGVSVDTAVDGGLRTSPDPEDQGGVLPLAQRVAMWCRDVSDPAGIDPDEFRHAFLAAFSEGAYTSAKDVPFTEVGRLQTVLGRVGSGELDLMERDGVWRLIDPRFGWPSSDPAGEHGTQPAAAPAAGVDWEAELEQTPGLGTVRLLNRARKLAQEAGLGDVADLATIPVQLHQALLAWLRERQAAA